MSDFDVIDLPSSSHPEAGEQAPDFTRPLVTREFWEDVTLSALVERGPVVLVFYPMDGTGKAKYTWTAIRDREWGIGDDTPTVVGLSISTPYEHTALIDRHDLPYGLFSDPGNGIARRYDVTHDHHGMAGLVGARPAVFVIDTSMTVQYAWATDQWPDLPPFDAIEEVLDLR